MTTEQTIRNAWGDYLAGFQWDYFVTLTTGLPTSKEALRHNFEDRFARKLAKAAGRSVSYFFVAERGTDGREHAHALLWANKKLRAEHVSGAWRLGFAAVEDYRHENRGAHYLTKTLHRDDAVYAISSNLPVSRAPYPSERALGNKLLA